jgi:3-deoxy-D-arabino-heptulosonate 7-phosphate (DAHP) synthase
LGNSFLFSPTDAVWYAKRKACAHAFYKDQLKIMMEVLKDKVEDSCEEWNKGIESSPDKSHEIDITKEFEKILIKNIVTISFGEDITDQTFEFQVRKTENGF